MNSAINCDNSSFTSFLNSDKQLFANYLLDSALTFNRRQEIKWQTIRYRSMTTLVSDSVTTTTTLVITISSISINICKTKHFYSKALQFV